MRATPSFRPENMGFGGIQFLIAASLTAFILLCAFTAPSRAQMSHISSASSTEVEVYNRPAAWLCRPGRVDARAVDEDATAEVIFAGKVEADWGLHRIDANLSG